MGVGKLINVRGSIWVVRGNSYSQMTYLSPLVSLWHASPSLTPAGGSMPGRLPYDAISRVRPAVEYLGK